MFHKKTILLAVSVGLIGCAVCFLVARNVFSDFEIKPNNGVITENGMLTDKEQTTLEPQAMPETNTSQKESDINLPEAVAASVAPRIGPETEIVYQYFDSQTKEVTEQKDVSPYFLLDLTLSDLQNYYADWEIMSFSDKKVVLRKTVDTESAKRYIVGTKDGFVAVFFEEEQNGESVYEITETPISSLSHAEQVRLNDGIYVEGDTELYKILEDYES